MDLRGLLTVGLDHDRGLVLSPARSPRRSPYYVIAQLGIGSGLGIVLSAAIAAAAEWAPPGQRARVLSWALLGQPAAWVVGMPLAGVVADVNWRLAWLTVPLVASLVALAAVRGRPRSAPAAALKTNWRRLGRNRAVAGWALGELLAFAGWSGTLVYCGALLRRIVWSLPATVGLVLAGSASPTSRATSSLGAWSIGLRAHCSFSAWEPRARRRRCHLRRRPPEPRLQRGGLRRPRLPRRRPNAGRERGRASLGAGGQAGRDQGSGGGDPVRLPAERWGRGRRLRGGRICGPRSRARGAVRRRCPAPRLDRSLAAGSPRSIPPGRPGAWLRVAASAWTPRGFDATCPLTRHPMRLSS